MRSLALVFAFALLSTPSFASPQSVDGDNSTLAVSSAASGSDQYLCPGSLSLVSAGQCRGMVARTYESNFVQVYDDAVKLCSTQKAYPVMIKNAEQQEYWKQRVTERWFILGIKCDTKTGEWLWYDGSKIDKSLPSKYDSTLNKRCTTGSSWDLHDDGMWNRGDNHVTDYFDIACIAQLPKPPLSDSACLEFQHDQPEKMCYMVADVSEDWPDAQAVCRSAGGTLASIHNAQANTYLRNLAASKGMTNGQLIGASAPERTIQFEWADGSAWNYNNFVPGFPIAGFGECLVMDTSDAKGQWANVDCATKLPFVCGRQPYAGGAVAACPGGNVNEGDLIRTPGFPESASEPCDFFLKVDPGMLVEIEIVLIEANSCCDYLEIFEGSFGGNSIANLTGAFTDGRYRTKSSNIMRVSWHPNGGVNVRGVLFTFHAV